MKTRKHIVGTRFSEKEMEKINGQVEKEHLSYVSTLIRKATFWYIEEMERRAKKQERLDAK